MHRTDPAAGTVVAEGTVIELYYNPPPELVQVPNVAGRPLEEARDILGADRLPRSARRREPSDELAEGLVIRTDPAGGARVRQDTSDHDRRVRRTAAGRDPGRP